MFFWRCAFEPNHDSSKDMLKQLKSLYVPIMRMHKTCAMPVRIRIAQYKAQHKARSHARSLTSLVSRVQVALRAFDFNRSRYHSPHPVRQAGHLQQEAVSGLAAAVSAGEWHVWAHLLAHPQRVGDDDQLGAFEPGQVGLHRFPKALHEHRPAPFCLSRDVQVAQGREEKEQFDGNKKMLQSCQRHLGPIFLFALEHKRNIKFQLLPNLLHLLDGIHGCQDRALQGAQCL